MLFYVYFNSQDNYVLKIVANSVTKPDELTLIVNGAYLHFDCEIFGVHKMESKEE